MFRWRTHLTSGLQRRWLGRHRQYRLQLRNEPDNPDQRIAEDLRLFTEGTIVLGLGVLNAVVTVVSFVAILILISHRKNLREEFARILPGRVASLRMSAPPQGSRRPFR